MDVAPLKQEVCRAVDGLAGELLAVFHESHAHPELAFEEHRASKLLVETEAAHVSAMPERGINALDALVTAYNAIAQLRQHIRATERIHGIFTEAGEAPNVVPARAAGAST